jgi:peptidoglycan/LPS O-acetylase OafA/YrhL
MGLIRFVLAVSILFLHANIITGTGYSLTDGQTAVQAFYIISGFYISFILYKKYTMKKGSYWLYITNRLLRIYPAYWAVLLFSIPWSISIYKYYFLFGNMRLLVFIFLALINFIIIGQEVIWFLGYSVINGSLFFVSNYHFSLPQLGGFLLVPQAWAISTIVIFYFFAPLIVKRKPPVLIGIILASLLARIIFYKLGFNDLPWTYAFFPFELALFALGALSYRIYKFIENRYSDRISNGMLIVLLTYLVLFSYIPIDYPFLRWLFYGLLVLFMPFIFLRYKSNKFDKKIGDYAYPVYISHYFVIWTVYDLIVRYKFHSKYLGVTSLIGTLLISFIVMHAIIKPIENYRQNRLRKADR